MLNEVGINALIAGEMGVSVSLVSGDDVLIEETEGDARQRLHRRRGQAGRGTKRRHHLQPRQGAPHAADRPPPKRCAASSRGDFKPFTMERPYRVEFKLRQSYPDSMVTGVAALSEFKLEKTGRPQLPLRDRQRPTDGLPARRDRRSGAPMIRRLLLARHRRACRSRRAAQGQPQQPAAPPRRATRRRRPPTSASPSTSSRARSWSGTCSAAASRVYIIADMEGLAAAVRNATEMRPVARGGSPQHERFRQELTDEVNAVIAGARAAGATQFIVNEGHGGTLFRNVLVDQLDPEAILIRGYPKPIVMSTGPQPDGGRDHDRRRARQRRAARASSRTTSPSTRSR